MNKTMTRPEQAVGIAKRFQKPLIMGIVNCTPDSFHEASRSETKESAIERAMRLVDEGADILDIGGQSTRPQSVAVNYETERARVIPVLAALSKQVKVQLSIDTDKAAIANEALDVGATIVNDVTAMRADQGMLKVALRAKQIVLMHMLGNPGTMQVNPSYKDCFDEVSRFLQERLNTFLAAGGRKDQVWIDPGIGFGKNLDHNLELIRRVPEFSAIAPVLLGVSRKSFLSKISPDKGPQDRIAGSLAVASWAALNGVKILRVHDVAETRRVIDTLAAVNP
ncbi:MAG: dihydropteroate synthase [Elusimicrobia bacterium]|nr:dihydropteroate synthase [Elusimicrobiota bacterium]